MSTMEALTPDDEALSLQALGKFLVDEQSGSFEPSAAFSDAFSSDKENTSALRYNARIKSESIQQRVAKVRAAQTPLLEAALPLLRALSEMPETIPAVREVELLKDVLKHEITLFSIVCDEADIPWKKMAIVRYCLCTALDEAAHGTSWGLQSGWSQSNLLNHFEGDNDGGNKFFLLVGRLSASPHEFPDVLEIMLHILGLGFEGRYSIVEDGERQLTRIRQRLLTLIQSTRETLPPALSPHAYCDGHAARKPFFFIPVRVSLALCVLLVAALFLSCKYYLSVPQELFRQQLLALQRLPVIEAPPPERLRLAVLLKDEIARHWVSVDESQRESRVIFHGDSMFSVGAASVRPERVDIIRRVAAEVQRVNGAVVIIGHTDSTPVRSGAFASNQALSEKRAEAVAEFFQAQGIAPEKITPKGAGDTQPIASNHDAQGRSQNRRVEIFVTY
ncbi:type VI secretion system protein TssL [Cronobacter malonaticus]|uniref:type VI secretion system protein TssL, long form n=1 Tax=Cronobacter malonaticus TaxID=413503 RepID=UPI00188B6481|nr:type VI secretion system protein TssL, long form [Cronobacter malonaticus]MBF4662053.1 type VI secretion system protein TssL [Cronobacter malonaticus]MBF4834697.1 type VI secretion system protein TssL [Cronobacter malonaticus]MBF4846045.1 type VI secretion system protein TssL [Cronobacter malonaticus]MBF4848847.1 type VI secretion system protein TssL [Cronobacter malonaticus]MBF4862083.1 type VI secretion system protein TssL [Cronobacter malonaticus]